MTTRKASYCTLRARLWHILLFGMLCFAAHLTDSRPAGAQVPAEIATLVEGRVINRATGEPLPGANVVALRTDDTTDASGPLLSGTTTSLNGSFSLSVSSSHPFTLRVSHVGFDAYEHTVAPGAGTPLDIALDTSDDASLEAVVVTGVREPRLVRDIPAAIALVDGEEIEKRIMPSPVDALKAVPGLSLAPVGIDRREVALRGFNEAFSDNALVLVDGRPIRLPGLEPNSFALSTIHDLDIDRVEVVRSPVSPLYGGVGDTGVIQFHTKDAFSYPGTSVSITAGERDYVQLQGRQAGRLASTLGYKVVAGYAQGDDWRLDADDPVDQGVLAQEFQAREDRYERVGGSVAFDYRPTTALRVHLTGGAASLDQTAVTDQGAVQAEDFRHAYAQLLVELAAVRAHFYYARNEAGDSYFYGRQNASGRLVGLVDESSTAGAQLQARMSLGPALRDALSVGVDVRRSVPRSEGTLFGRNEGRDELTEAGAFAHLLLPVTPRLRLSGGGRLDLDTVTDDVALSPRAGALYDVTRHVTMHAAYNRLYDLPNPVSFFFDASGFESPVGGPFRLVFQGRGSVDGFTYDDFRASGQARSILPARFGASVPAGAVPLQDVYATFAAGAAEALRSGSTPLPIDLGALGPDGPALLADALLALVPLVQGETTGQLGIPGEEGVRFVAAPEDVPPLGPTRGHTVEAGLVGSLGDRLTLSLNLFHTWRSDFVGPQLVESPLVYLPSLAEDVQPALTDALSAAAADPSFQALLAGLDASGEELSALLALLVADAFDGQPVAAVQTDESILEEASPTDVGVLVAARNFGKVRYWGAEWSAKLRPNSRTRLEVSGGFMNDNLFDEEELGEEGSGLTLPLNATRWQLAGGAEVVPVAPLRVGTRVLYRESYPFQSGPYAITVDDHVLVDVEAGADLSALAEGLSVALTIQNVFDDEVRYVGGAPEIGRLALVRLNYVQ